MDELEQLKTRVSVTNQLILEFIERDVSNRIFIAGLQKTIGILQQQLRDKDTPVEPPVEIIPPPPV